MVKPNGGRRPSSQDGLSFDQLVGDAPLDGGRSTEAAAALSSHVVRSDRIISQYPPKMRRSPDQQSIVDEIRESCRIARSRFMRSRGCWLYDRLVAHHKTYRSLAELSYAAAELVPGLVPTRPDMAEEKQRLQAEKEGLEIDQGIFFSGLLQSKRTGCRLIDSMLLPTDRASNLFDKFRVEGRLDLGPVHVERRGPVAHVTVNNAGSLNAEDEELAGAMETSVDLVLLDDQVRVAVLRGGVMSHPRYRGRRVFNSGINLKKFRDGKLAFVEFFLCRELGYLHKIFRGLRNPIKDAYLAKPWIAAVDSFAIGGGAQLLFAFDRVIACAEAYVALPAANVRIVPGLANLRLARSADGRLSRQMILSGRKIRATESDARFFFDEIVGPEEMDTAISKATEVLNSGAVVANRALLNAWLEPLDDFRGYMAEFSLIQARRLLGSDVLSTIASFGTAPPTSAASSE